MTTYQQEQEAKRKAHLKTAPRYVFNATGSDVFDRRAYTPADGTIVLKTQPHGAPRNGTMGQCYIMSEDGDFIGMVDQRSLTRVDRKPSPLFCQWFALCKNKATGTTPHPALGDVPTCDRCHEFVTGEKRGK